LSLSADSVAHVASAPKGVSKAFSRELRAKALSKADRLCNSIADKAPQRAPLPGSSSAKLAPRSGAKGLSLSVDSVAYAASTSKGTPKVLSREARAEALFCANPLCGDKRSRTSSYARSKRASVLDRLGPTVSDLRGFLTSKRKSESFQTSSSRCQQVGCQLKTVHSVHCRLGPILATSPSQRSVFDRLTAQAPSKHHKRSVSRDLPSASVNMTGRGQELRRGRQAPHDTPYSSPDPDYSPGLGEVLVHEEGVFRNTRSRVAIPTVMNSLLPQRP